MISNEQLDRANINIYNNLSVEKLENFLLELQQKSQYGSKAKYDITKDGYAGNGLYCLGGIAYTGKKGWDQFNKALLDEIIGPQFKIELNEKYYNDDTFKMKNKNNKYYKTTADESRVENDIVVNKLNEPNKSWVNKTHYIPNINEFYDGFEFEVLDFDHNLVDHVFVKETASKYTEFSIYDSWIENNQIRVKILDKNDLVELGFKLIENESYERTDNDKFIFNYRCKKDTLTLTYANWFVSDGREYRIVKIEDNIDVVKDQDESGSVTSVLFSGVIKNKSELSKLLKQLQ